MVVLTFDKLYDMFNGVMRTNVSTLLREFPRVRRAALAGEEVVIETREGNLRLTADKPEGTRILGVLRGRVTTVADLTLPTSGDVEWDPKP